MAARVDDLRAESGFIMMEVLISAVLMVVAAIAIMSALDGNSAASARSKARSVGAQLAEQDQERMRGMRFVDLSNYTATRTPSIEGVPYKVVSESDWIRDATGGTESCVSNSTEADYIRIRSTVTSTIVGTRTKPVVIESLVAPPVNAFAAAQGTLGVAVKDRNGAPLTGVSVSISGPTALTDITNSAGCAVFAFIPVGAYTISLNQAGWVTSKVIGQATVQDGKVIVTDVEYDRASTINATFYTKLPNASGTLVDVVAQGWDLSAVKKGNTPLVFAASPAPGPVAQISATNLFPFADGYGMYSGDCSDNATTVSNDPTKSNPAYYDTYPGFVKPDPGATQNVQVLQPAIKVQVVHNTGTSSAPVWTVASGAHVVIRSTSTSCKDPFPGFTTDANGYVTKTPTTAYPYDPSLPFGQYKVCADIQVTSGTKTTTKSASVTVNNTNPLAPDAKTLQLASGGAVCA